jgi:drug/metabolite transporter (DMT)-like permease
MTFHISRSRAERAYLLRLVGSMGAFILVLLIVRHWFKSSEPPAGAWLYAAAILPALPILGAIGAVGRYLVEETDEYQRALLIRAVLWATGAALAAATVRDFLIEYAHVSPFESGFVFFVFCIALGVAQVVVRLMERA